MNHHRCSLAANRAGRLVSSIGGAFLALGFGLAGAAVGQGPALQADWLQSPVNGHWYGADYTARTWSDANDVALSLSGSLATIRSQAEQDWISATFAPYQKNGAIWIGLLQEAGGQEPAGGWGWSSGESLLYTNWGAVEPNDAGPSGEDVGVQVFAPNYWWQDADGSNAAHGPLIELQAKPAVGWSWPHSAPTAADPRWLDVGDMNGDGLDDLVVPYSGANRIEVWLASPDGLSLATSVACGQGGGPVETAVGDLNADGLLDVAATVWADDRVEVFLGDGAGGLTPLTSLAVLDQPGGLEAVDFDGDGALDLAVPSATANKLQLWLNDGAGGFSAGTQLTTDAKPYRVRAGDLDADGAPDLVVANQVGHSLSIFMSTPGGQFSPHQVVPLSGPPGEPILVDIGLDGVLDVAVSTEGGTLDIVRGDANGTYATAWSMSVGTSGSSPGLVALRANADVWWDLAVATQDSGGRLQLLTGDGAGAFQVGEYLDSGSIVESVVQVVDAQGRTTLCAASRGDDELYFHALQLLTDCNGNGVQDFVEISNGTAADCDSNGVLDECDLAANPSLDYDQNGVLDDCECLTSNYCLAVGNSAGTQATIGSQGPTTLASNGFALTVAGAPPFKPGIFFYGATQGQLFVGEGVLCIAPDFQRLQPVLLTDQQGSVSMPLDFTAPPFAAGTFAVAPLSTWNFQFWYRDPLGGPAGFNFSDGLEVTFCP